MTTGNRAICIAEVAQTHDGSLGQAHAFIDAVATTGCTAIKFQTHIADAESTPGEPFRVHFSYEDKTRYDYWRRMEFTKDQWAELRRHAVEKGLWFLSSPFSMQAFDLLADIGVNAWKVGSGEVGSRDLLRRMAATEKPIYVSTGMSSWREIESAATFLRELGADFTLLQCTSSYPHGMDRVGLNVMTEFGVRFGCPYGLSDHSGTIFPGLAAATLGASVVEVHVTLSPHMFGPDVSSSLTIENLELLNRGLDAIAAMRARPVDKDAAAAEMDAMRRTFRKSAIALRDIGAGERVSASNVTFKKPGTGMSEEEFLAIEGRPALRRIAKGEFLTREHFIK
jgi:N-acetylneuraminate synthase